jgi:hypothetical protein
VTALVALDPQPSTRTPWNQTLGIVLKTKEDLKSIRGENRESRLARRAGS